MESGHDTSSSISLMKSEVRIPAFQSEERQESLNKTNRRDTHVSEHAVVLHGGLQTYHTNLTSQISTVMEAYLRHQRHVRVDLVHLREIT